MMKETCRSLSKWPPESVVVQIATFNEAASIGNLLEAIHCLLPAAYILVIDDDSPDGTSDIVSEHGAKQEHIHLIRRVGRRGIGTATLEGLHYAIRQNASVAIHLDGDLSHNPVDLPRLLKALSPATGEAFDIAIGSRKVKGGHTIGWSIKRHIASWLVAWFTRFVLRVPVRDPSSGFRAIRLQCLESMDLDGIATGYAFFEDFLCRAKRAGISMTEIPITFTDRRFGESKVNLQEVCKSIRDLLKIASRTWFG